MFDKNAKWIWINNDPKPNEYAVFEEKFNYAGGKATFTICAEMDYVLYVNGTLAGFSQYAGYPKQKYYDELDITSLCVNGENTFTLTGRYEGVRTHVHIVDGAGVIYTLSVDGNTVCYSHKGVLGGYDNRYVQNTQVLLSGQLGYGSDMRVGGYECNIPCVESDITYNLVPRPIKKTVPLPFVEGKLIDSDKNLYDVGRETAGYIRVKFKATKPGKVKIGYGQHITDGGVRYNIWNREFAFNFEMPEG